MGREGEKGQDTKTLPNTIFLDPNDRTKKKRKTEALWIRNHKGKMWRTVLEGGWDSGIRTENRHAEQLAQAISNGKKRRQQGAQRKQKYLGRLNERKKTKDEIKKR